MNLREEKYVRQIIAESIDGLFENVQLADKAYFKTGKLPQKVRDMIVGITGGDNYTKILTDIYSNYLHNSFDADGNILNVKDLKKVEQLYYELKGYNKNVFPVKGLDIYKPGNIVDIADGLLERKLIIELFKKLPSVAWRNMRDDIRLERSSWEMRRYREDLEYFLGQYSLLDNRSDELRQKILNKMFKSKTNLAQLLNFTDEKENLLGGAEFTKEQIKEMSEAEDFEIVYDQGTTMIVRVDSPYGIKAIGCNSLWCFTYGSGFDGAWRNWNNYSHHDMVYVIIDFRYKSDNAEFMHVLIKPLIGENGRFIKFSEEDGNNENYPLFNMANDNYYDPYSVLSNIFGENYKKIIRKYMNFEY